MKKIILVNHFVLLFASFSSGQINNYLFYNDILTKYKSCYDNGLDCYKPAWELSFIGKYKEALLIMERNKSPFIDDNIDLEKYKIVDAREFIINEAKSQQVVMLNEAHHVPYHRIFTKSLLKELYQSGYRYLGCEGISDLRIMDKDKPNIKSGFYIKETQYANLIKYAKNIGYTVFKYDTSGTNAREREIHQAKKIKNIIDNDKTAKVIIHAGWGHIREDTAIGKLMAYRFKEITKINPFTINQTRMNEQGSNNSENSAYKKIKTKLKRPSILVDRSGNVYTDNITDIIIFHPPTQYYKNRPNWLFTYQNSIRYSIQIPKKIDFPCSVQVFDNTDLEGVPVDNFEVTSYTKKVILCLPKKGVYKVCFFQKDTNNIFKIIGI